MQGTARARLNGLAGILTVAAALLASAPGASAATFHTLYSFCSQTNCADGKTPVGSLVEDASGDLFGTTASGGANQQGIVFELIPGRHGSWKEVVLYAFCSKTDCADGALPRAPLILDTNGNLYGTTVSGGMANVGTVFELIRSGRKYRLKTLSDFCAGTCIGNDPEAGLAYRGQAGGQPYDGVSPLFGSVSFNAVFEMTPPAPGKKKWKLKIIHQFCLGDCTDGSNPSAALVVDDLGNVYGTTSSGSSGGGTVFELSPSGSSWSLTVLHGFCGLPNCLDGGQPAGLVMNASGELFGLAALGGNQTCGGSCGILYRVIPNGASSQYKTLYDFCTPDNCTDGQHPSGTLAVDASGNLFGVTLQGGDETQTPSGGGTLFELSGTTYQVLHDFCSAPGCSDGTMPLEGILIESNGTLLGTAGFGGEGGNGGTVYRLK